MPIDEQELSPIGKAVVAAQKGSLAKAWSLGILGAILGGVAGWYVFHWAISQGYYALAMPGATVGAGFALLSRRKVLLGSLFCAVAGFLVMAACEWSIGPFKEDGSFVYFLTHIHKVDSQMTLVMMAVGTVLAFWFGRGR